MRSRATIRPRTASLRRAPRRHVSCARPIARRHACGHLADARESRCPNQASADRARDEAAPHQPPRPAPCVRARHVRVFDDASFDPCSRPGFARRRRSRVDLRSRGLVEPARHHCALRRFCAAFSAGVLGHLRPSDIPPATRRIVAHRARALAAGAADGTCRRNPVGIRADRLGSDLCADRRRVVVVPRGMALKSACSRQVARLSRSLLRLRPPPVVAADAVRPVRHCPAVAGAVGPRLRHHGSGP